MSADRVLRTFDVTGISDAAIADVEAHLAGAQPLPEGSTYTVPPGFSGWTCFHCGSTFTTVRGGQLHFGSGTEQPPPLCRFVGTDGDEELMRRIRAIFYEGNR